MRGLKLFIGACFAFALLLAAAAAMAQGAPPAPTDEIAAPAGEVAVAPTARDDQIAARIGGILAATGWYRATEVRVDDGVVFLDGRTDSEDRRLWAQNLAQKTQDVAAVVNRIEIDRPVGWAFAPALQEIADMGRGVLGAAPLILLALVILPVAWLAAGAVGRLARRLLEPRLDSPLLRDVVAWAVSAPVFLIGLYIILQVAGLTGLAVSVLGGAGVIGIVVGFAFRDIAENFLASLLLSIRRPFRAGDFVDVAGQSGFVRSMNTRSTLLLSPEGNHIQIPNATVFKNIITNYSTAPSRRETLHVGIGYDASVAQAQEIVIAVLRGHPAVIDDPEPLVLVDELASSTVNLDIHYWFDGRSFSAFKVKSALLRLIKKALIEAGVSMPDDAREIVFPEGVPIVEQPPAAADAPATAIADRTSAPESAAPATESEGDLSNEREDVEANAAAAAAEDLDGDLLARADDKPPAH